MSVVPARVQRPIDCIDRKLAIAIEVEVSVEVYGIAQQSLYRISGRGRFEIPHQPETKLVYTQRHVREHASGSYKHPMYCNQLDYNAGQVQRHRGKE